jgi:HK97 family phage major capsid protein
MSTLVETLIQRREGLTQKLTDMAAAAVAADNRALSVEEQTTFDSMYAEAESLGERIVKLQADEQRQRDIDASFQPQPVVRDSGLGAWAREARYGDAYELELRGSREARAMSAAGGIGKEAVSSQLWEYAVNTSQILQAGADVIFTQNGNTLPLPVVTVHATGASAAANAPITASDATITTVDLAATKYGYITLVPSELVADATFDLDGYLARAAGRELGNQITTVASAAMVAGFTASGATSPTASIGATGSVFSDALITLFHSVSVPYRTSAAWLFSDPTAAAIRKAKDSSGRYLWETAITAGSPDLILGKGTYIDPNLPQPTGTNKIIYFGDFSALKVRIAGGLRFERSDDYAFGNDQVAFRALVRTGAAVVDANAVKFLQLTAS